MAVAYCVPCIKFGQIKAGFDERRHVPVCPINKSHRVILTVADALDEVQRRLMFSKEELFKQELDYRKG